MKFRYILLVMVMLIGTASAQYLSYSELIGLLNIARVDVKVDDYLTKRGFEYSVGNYKGGVKNYSYQKKIGNDYVSVGIYYDENSVYTSVGETSCDIQRWNYYKKIIDGNEYKQTNSFTKEDGALWIYYQNKLYEILMIRSRVNNGPLYDISLRKI